MTSPPDAEWRPGDAVVLTGPRVAVRTLLPSDVQGDWERWYGSPERRAQLWTPSIPSRDYLLGLIKASDQKTRFAFLVSVRDGAPVGFAKLQVFVDGQGKSAIPTIVIGDEARAGDALGLEAVRAMNWFSFERLGVDRLAPRIYEANAALLARAKSIGYQVSARRTETFPDGSKKTVALLDRSRAHWLEARARHPEHFECRRLEATSRA